MNQCSTCRHWQPKPHDGWEEPSYGGTYDVADLRIYLANDNSVLGHWPGKCTLTPEWRDATAKHGCASHTAASEFKLVWRQYAEILDLRRTVFAQRAEIRRLTATLKELRAKRRAERIKQHAPAEAAE